MANCCHLRYRKKPVRDIGRTQRERRENIREEKQEGIREKVSNRGTWGR